jgi:hypothetical protein
VEALIPSELAGFFLNELEDCVYFFGGPSEVLS